MAETNVTSANMTPEQINAVLGEIADRSLAITRILEVAIDNASSSEQWAQVYAAQQLAMAIGTLADRFCSIKTTGGIDEWMFAEIVHGPRAKTEQEVHHG